MGRTVPSFRMVIEGFGWEWIEFKRALRGMDKDAFDELMNHARRHAEAGTNMPNPDPFEPTVISILVEHEKATPGITNWSTFGIEYATLCRARVLLLD